MIGPQKLDRVAELEPLGLERVIHEDLRLGVGDRSTAGHGRAESAVQVDAEGEDIVTQRLAVLILHVWGLGDGSSAHEGRRCGAVLMCQVLGGAQLFVTQS